MHVEESYVAAILTVVHDFSGSGDFLEVRKGL